MGAMPGMGGMGGMGDPDTLLAMLDNPMFRQSLQQIASNPEQARAVRSLPHALRCVPPAPG